MIATTDTRQVPPPPALGKVTVLHHCRCQDCEHWSAWAHGGSCRHMTIRNGVRGVVEYPPDAWHWCRRYRGPRVSRDVWVWRHPATVAAQGRDVGPGTNDSQEGGCA